MSKFELTLKRTFIKSVIIEAENQKVAEEIANTYNWDIQDSDDEEDSCIVDEID